MTEKHKELEMENEIFQTKVWCLCVLHALYNGILKSIHHLMSKRILHPCFFHIHFNPRYMSFQL